MLIALVVFLVLIEAVFTALEIAFGAISRTRLRALATPDADTDISPLNAQRAGQALRLPGELHRGRVSRAVPPAA